MRRAVVFARLVMQVIAAAGRYGPAGHRFRAQDLSRIMPLPTGARRERGWCAKAAWPGRRWHALLRNYAPPESEGGYRGVPWLDAQP